MNKLLLSLLIGFTFLACTNDSEKSEGGDEQVSEATQTANNDPGSIEGTWVRSYQINDEIIEVGFTLNEDKTVDIIKMRDEYSKYWRLATEDTLQFYYQNRVTNDTLISKNYFIANFNATELVLVPHNAPKNYKEFYARK